MKLHSPSAIIYFMATSCALYSMDNEVNTLSDAAVLARMEKYLKKELSFRPCNYETIYRNGQIVSQKKSTVVDHGYIYMKGESTCIQFLTHTDCNTYTNSEDRNVPLGLFLEHHIDSNGSVTTKFYLSKDLDKERQQRNYMKRYWQNIPGRCLSEKAIPREWYTVKKD